MSPIRKITQVAVLVLAALPVTDAAAAFPGGNGKIAFTSERDGTGDDDEVFSMNADGSEQTNLTQLGPAKDGQPAFSPDGERIAFVSNRDGDLEIYVMNADGSGQTRLTSSVGADEFPAWSPDGTKIVFESARLGATEVFVMNANGSNQTNLTNNAAIDAAPVMSPDGQKIAFHSNRDGAFEIYTMSATGSGQTRLTNSTGLFANWSPDGQKIAFDRVVNGQREIYSMDANGSNQTNLTNDAGFDTDAAWSPDGQKIAFATTRNGNFEVYSMDANGSNQTNLSNDGGADKQPDWGAVVDDGDSLPDTWEEDGIDGDGDGDPDLDLPAMGADPDHKDIFVEIDYMAQHQPDLGAIADVVHAFANAPVTNPDGTTGIRLHVLVDDVLTEIESIDFGCGVGADFDAIKQNFFGTDSERAAGTPVTEAKRLAFRYGIWAHGLCDLGVSGISELPGNDFLVTLGRFPPVPPDGHAEGTRIQQAGTFIHEFGHALGLRHGGGDNINCKPNYLSVMSYTFQMARAPVTGRPLDYSRAALPALLETGLSEPAGIGGPAGLQTAFGPPALVVAPANGPIDWNRDGDAADTLVSADINDRDGAGGSCDGTGVLLSGFDDWSHLDYDFRASPDFADGDHDTADQVVEQTYEELAANSPDSDGDGFKDFEDLCPTVANPDQADGDHDGTGDACEPPSPPTGGPAGGTAPNPTAAPTKKKCKKHKKRSAAAAKKKCGKKGK